VFGRTTDRQPGRGQDEFTAGSVEGGRPIAPLEGTAILCAFIAQEDAMLLLLSKLRLAIGWYLFCMFMFASPVQALPDWPLPDGVKTISVNDYEIAYQEPGSGIPIVLVHGTLNDYRVWPEQVSELSGKFLVIAVSLRHHYPEIGKGQGDD